jgi:hypothetical protein
MRILFLLLACIAAAHSQTPRLRVASNHRYLETSDGKPFFWLGDTGWLMFQKLDRAETERYLEDRRAKGFNVIQAMVLHAANDKNAYGNFALTDSDPARPVATSDENGYWNHVDWVVDRAAQKGIYIAMVAAWGSLANGRKLTEANVEAYSRFLALRYRNRPNIIWLTGGDVRGDRHTEVWRTMGRTFKQLDPDHLVSFHPFGRTASSTWFHSEPWLDFNMFQSGHRRYDQDTDPGAKGEDNWRFVEDDLAKSPPKPTIDGEPSYEKIPQGLHDTTQPYWTDKDIRRYAWWSVFAGAFGHTYGHNSVMQMYKPDSGKGGYGPKNFWYEAIDDPGAGQMRHLKNLILSRTFMERVPDQSLIAGGNGTRYERVIATRGAAYALLYTYSGQPFEVQMGRISGGQVRASWYDPRTGASQPAGTFSNRGTRRFAPPQAGTDWALLLDDASKSRTDVK